ncbi:MAG: HypC/HybG/HupF family hydrogenase formation chaperone [Candidatus Omnitrophica bacterium]|nr:HypC/HybG/HupF family hydrogenase formation chaperone [Candidatus Omnitrophota bacterium]MCM8809314.1 HypC/HybG/HupF family hydrogenase formation chaperone [Candidatus Omnitrophota bacterium]MCM8833682.1 HypC/HybG/HupF family hydrogenase formation chaperone [Candidatus Omnitrophota bacterium]
MCLAIPMKVEKVEGDFAIVSIGNVKREVNISLLENVKKGDYVIVHAGFAIEKLDKKEAEKTLEIFKEIK